MSKLSRTGGIAGVVALVLIGASALTGIGITSTSASMGPSASASPSATNGPQKLTPALKKLLTVSDGTVAGDQTCVKLIEAAGGTSVNGIYKLIIGALDARKAYQNGKLPNYKSDFLSIKISGKSDVKKRAYLESTICKDPLLGVSLAHEFAHMTVGDVKIVDLNTSWLSPYNVSTDKISTLATAFVPTFGVSSPSTKQYAAAVTQNLKYQSLAIKLVTLLSAFQLDGVRSLSSVSNYHLVAGGVTAGVVPAVELNSAQENLPALTLRLTAKDVCAPYKVIGFNLMDSRPEVFPTPSCATKPTPSSTPKPRTTHPTTPKPKPTTPPGSTPTPKPTSTCDLTTHYVEKGKCLLQKSSDPKQYVYPTEKPPAPAPTTPPEATPPVVITTPTPEPVASASSNPEPVQSSAPVVVPTPEPSAPTPSDAPSTCSPPPGKTTC